MMEGQEGKREKERARYERDRAGDNKRRRQFPGRRAREKETEQALLRRTKKGFENMQRRNFHWRQLRG